MERKFCTVEELIKSGRIRNGDFVEYVPTVGRYVTRKEETGWESEVIETDLDARWIFHGYDEYANYFCIKTADGVNEVTLNGSIGFKKGYDVLNSICEECYSIPEMEIYASSMDEEDYIEEVDFVPPEKLDSFAYYPHGSLVFGKTRFNGSSYKRTKHEGKFARFYGSTYGGKKGIDEDGNVYRRPLVHKPVFVAETYYDYECYSNISKDYWLASTCTRCNPHNADFCMRYVSQYGVDATFLCSSDGRAYDDSHAIRPIVCLNATFQVDITDEHRDGSSPEKAWKLICGF